MTQTAIRSEASVGRLPFLVLVAAGGFALVSVSFGAFRADAPPAELLFWLGLALITVPAAIRLVGTAAARPERIGLVVVVGMGLYLVKVVHSPAGFTLYDELQHIRPTADLIASGRAFGENPLLPIYALFPGIQIATGVLASWSPDAIYVAGILVVGVARIVMMLALVLIFERATVGTRVACLGAFVYAANPGFVFFAGQWAYESLALPLAVAAVAFAAGRNAPGAPRAWLTGLALLAIATVTVTHHVTSYLLLAMLIVWLVSERLVGIGHVLVERRDVPRVDRAGRLVPPVFDFVHPLAISGVVAFAAVCVLGWLVWVADRVLTYLGPQLLSLEAIVRLVLGDSPPRRLFATEPPPPAWEPIVAFSATALILLLAVIGGWELRRAQWRTSLLVALGLLALSYPASLVLRLTDRGAEIAGRLFDFIFVAIGLVAAVGLLRVADASIRGRRPIGLRGVAVAVAVVVMAGGVIAGAPRWVRYPGAYLVSADTRSIEPQGVAAATWAAQHLGENRRIVADRVNRLLFGSYGRQRPVTDYADGIRTSELFDEPTVTADDRAMLREGDIEYVVVDRRLTDGLPLVGRYFETGEPNDRNHVQPMPPGSITKWDDDRWFDRIFDSGDIRIYHVERSR